MMLDQYSRNIVKAFKDPTGVVRWLNRQFAPKKSGALCAKVNAAAATLAQRVTEISRNGHRRIAVFGDRPSLDSVKAQLPGVETVWLSSDYGDLDAGARTIHTLSVDAVDGFLIIGGDVAASYRQTLRWMQGIKRTLPVYWVSASFEFCGGTMPIAAECTDADVLIFNHFPDFFGQKDPLLVRIEVFDQASHNEQWFVLRPKESIRVRLSEWLPSRSGPACVYHYCAHPRLTGGRHYRWRSTALFAWDNSVAMAHSDTDFRQPDETTVTEHKIGLGTMAGGSAAITIPNYDRAIGPSGKKSIVLKYNALSEIDRNIAVRIDEATIRLDGRTATFDDFFGAKFKGCGGSFWFAFDNGNEGRSPSLSANHSVRGDLLPKLKRPSTDEAAAFVADLAKHEIILDPHAVPVEPAGSPVEFGFEFDMNFPVLRHFDVVAFDAAGRVVGSARYEKADPGAVFANATVRKLGLEGRDVALLVVSPDWIAVGADPRGRGAAGNLVARLRKSGDYDATEFQNCWRNLGLTIGSLPHWLSQDRMLAGRTNVLCGIGARDGDRIGVSCVNASGRKTYAERAEAVVRVLASNGSEIEGRVEIGPFGHRMVWLDDVTPGWRKHLANGFGSLIVQSLDADLNANVLTIRGNRSLALQHMWGY